MATRDTSGQNQPNRKVDEALDRAQREGQRLGQDAAEQGRGAIEAGRQQVNAAGTRVRSLLEQQAHRAADQIGGVADALHQAAKQLDQENNGQAAHYVGQAAERVEGVADMLRDATLDDMIGQVEGFARRQPEVFVGGAFALGFLFARFIKSSGEPRPSRGRRGRGSATSRHQADTYDFDQERSTIGGSYPAAGRRATAGRESAPVMADGPGAARATPIGMVPDETLGSMPATGAKPTGTTPGTAPGTTPGTKPMGTTSARTTP